MCNCGCAFLANEQTVTKSKLLNSNQSNPILMDTQIINGY